MKNIELIKAPTIFDPELAELGLLPDRLIKVGLLQKLGIKNVKELPPITYNPEPNPDTEMLNLQAIAEHSVALVNSVEEVIQRGNFPIVMGGDSSIVLGNLLALKKMGRYGLFFLDGHADFYQSKGSTRKEWGDVNLATISGRDTADSTNTKEGWPLVKDEDIVLFGARDQEEKSKYHDSHQVSETPINVFSLEAIKEMGVEKSTKKAMQALLRNPVQGFWVHIDTDVLSDKDIPDVDYRIPGGLSLEELSEALNILLSSGKVSGLDLTIFKSTPDTDGKMSLKLVDAISNGFKAAFGE